MQTTINFRISTELKDKLQEISEENNQKISILVREIITDFIDNYYSEEQEIHTVILEVPANYNQFQ